MGPDDGVQRVLKTGVASAGAYGVSIAVWMRSGKVVAEGRVFPRDPSPDIEDIVETIKVEAKNPGLAVVLLEMQVEKYGQLKQIQWWPPVGSAIEVDQRVWVADQSAEGGTATGVVASVSDDLVFSGGFVVLLDTKKTLVTCSKDQRGTRWDLAD